MILPEGISINWTVLAINIAILVLPAALVIAALIVVIRRAARR